MSSERDQPSNLAGAVHLAPGRAGWTWPMGTRVLLVVLLAASGMALQLGGRKGNNVEVGPPVEPMNLRVDPNTAPASVLEALPHVGPGLTARIIEQRAIRPFDSGRDLRRVRGIGPATLARI